VRKVDMCYRRPSLEKDCVSLETLFREVRRQKGQICSPERGKQLVPPSPLPPGGSANVIFHMNLAFASRGGALSAQAGPLPTARTRMARQ
jgi:hypothetical protein